MHSEPNPIKLKRCLKTFTRGIDKALPPQDTVNNIRDRLRAVNMDIFAGSRRVDAGRLGIPVYMGVCGTDARAVMPVRKQMGKGASPEQARASALMEVMERYAFFSFWETASMIRASWSEAEKLFGAGLLPIEEICRSVNDPLSSETARAVMDLHDWSFYPATRLDCGEIVWLPLDWFRMLGEFNGSSAGNTPEESILQGISELIERHACALADSARAVLPTIDPASCGDAVLAGLLQAFKRENINIVLKDLTGHMPMPVVAALAWDPATFPRKSEIVFTAGAATSSAKAAIRAITEVAQLGGDFCTNSCYEASGLPKFTSLEQCQWLLEGPRISLASLPCMEQPDMLEEIRAVVNRLKPVNVYAVETTSQLLGVPAHYCMAPGLQFRERDHNQSVGLFVGRKLAEEAENAPAALERLGQLIPHAFYLPFFKGLAALRTGQRAAALEFFEAAIPMQPDAEALAMVLFYAGYAHTLASEWEQALPCLRQAAELCPDMKEYANLLGVALYKTGNYSAARKCFDNVLKIDKGSAMDIANRGLCNEALGDVEAAMADFQTALELDASITFAAQHLDAMAGKS